MPLPHIQFDTAMAAATAYYPSNGAGGYTATAADSFVSDAEETELRSVCVPGSASGAQSMQILHEDGTTAYEAYIPAQTEPWKEEWAEGEGISIRGAWSVEFPSVASATDFWRIQFQVVRGL